MKGFFLPAILLIVIASGCKEKFVPSISSPSTGYLVVEGFINSGPEPTSISLTRTTRLFDSVNIIHEHNAVVNVESDSREMYPLYENANNLYVSSYPLPLDNNKKYRLHIVASDGREYASSFVTVRRTPPVDSISWTRENGGLNIYANTHDSQSDTGYYRWTYEETWEIHSAYVTNLKYDIDSTGLILGLAFRDNDTSVYKCWQSHISTNVVLGSSEKFTTNKIHSEIISIEPQSEKLSVLYSVLLHQYVLSHDAYLFFQKVRKNTEQIGSIFDAQPSELKGNIRCLADTSEIVIGFVDISEETRLRTFISNAQLPGWNYTVDCPEAIVNNDLVSIRQNGVSLLPVTGHKFGPFGDIIDFYVTYPYCVDCTTRGTNVNLLSGLNGLYVSL